MLLTAMPVIGRGLGLPAAASVWLLLAATVPMIGLMLPLGSWTDAAGNRAAFVLAAAGYALSATAVGLAPGFGWVVGARAVEGCFASLLTILIMTVASSAAGPGRRAQAIGVVTAAGTVGSLWGPQLAALVLPALGWRAVFLFSPPLLLVALGLAWFAVPGTLRLARPRPIWVLEGLALTVAVGGFFLLLRNPPTTMRGVVIAVALGAAVAAGLATWSRLPQATAIFQLVGSRRLGVPLLGLGSMTFAVGAMAFAVPFSLLARADSGLEVSAIAFTVFALAQGLSSGLIGPGVRRFGSWSVAVAGAAGLGLSMLLLVPLDPGWGAAWLIARVALIGLGSGAVAGIDQALVMSLAPPDRAGAASAVSGLLRSLFFSVGAAIASAAAWLAPTPIVGIRVILGVATLAAFYALARMLLERRLLGGVDREEASAPVLLQAEPATV